MVLLGGRFFRAKNNVVQSLQACNPNIQFDVYLFAWETETRKNKQVTNDILAILQKFQPKQFHIERFEDVFASSVSSFQIMVYIRNRVVDLLPSEMNYAYYIFSRPDIVSLQLDLATLNMNNDNVVFAYRCPAYAKVVCDDFCDWLFVCNRFTLQRVRNLDFQHEPSKSNEWNFKHNYQTHGICVKLIGTVDQDIFYKDLY